MVHRHNTYAPAEVNETQLETLKAICDTLFQSHTGEEAEKIKARLPKDAPEWQAAAVDEFVSKSFTEIDGAIDHLLQLIGSSLSPTVKADLLTALTLLSTTAGTCILAGGYLKPFAKLSVKEREAIMQSWGSSRITMRRGLMRAFTGLSLFCIYAYSDLLCDAIGYPSPNRRKLYKTLEKPKFAYSFITPRAAVAPSTIPVFNTEVLIIGSGAGGGVASSRIAKDYKTLIVEKGVYAPTGEKSRSQHEAFEELFQNAGIIATESGSTTIFAGSVFGGGTTVNWSGSLKTQHFVRDEWAKEKGLEWFLSDGYTEALDAVCARMGVSEAHIKHSKSNSKLIEGSRKVGYHVDPIPQNTDGHEHACGFCSFGCPYGEKQGTVETFMVDAAKAGAEFLTAAQVHRLLFIAPNDTVPTSIVGNLDDLTYTTSRTKCIGAELDLDDGSKLVVLASKSVVLSAGSINSPAVLLRSGLKNPMIGKNFHCHPCTFVTALFDEQINPWDGAIMTSVSNVVENKDGTHHGAKVEVCMSMPSSIAGAQESWLSSADHKSVMLEYNHSLSFITLVRDRDSGQVFIDANGHPRVKYDISAYDGDSSARAVVAAAEILLSTGAKRISTSQVGVPSYIAEPGHKGLIDPKFKAWVAQVQAASIRPGWAGVGAAHQMGTCQMGTTPSTSVIDPRGRVWNTSNLYIADASVFPTASGVNPMITTMACAWSIAGFLLEDLAAA
ncbi:hypothetical protein CI109_104970 [Kwoniella shandongensis]|uniref:Long-chain-alcohol oxidase n=1 Tax=Kwoniella shandongensis TaxID=1734106 RepID=A0A5M6BS49_9TREE|nr:uncharacterized protein CI109_006685 [Kwoniella shandongensis]KAA5524961.1 hypothetical protein CI109_006685 [Kwoniella shandongensis]